MLVCACIALVPCQSRAQAPAWWQQRGVLNGASSDDYAAINQGQLKNLVLGAVVEMDFRLPGGAGLALFQLLELWAHPAGTPDDYAAVNLGQLKAVAVPIYDRLKAVGYVADYPWVGSSSGPDDYAMANIGQAKNLFVFNLTLDTDSNGLPDWWETKYFGQATGSNPNSLAPVGNGLTLRQCFQLGINPVAVDTDGDGVPDSLDAYALDATRSQLPALDPNDHTPPTITLVKPIGVILGP